MVDTNYAVLVSNNYLEVLIYKKALSINLFNFLHYIPLSL